MIRLSEAIREGCKYGPQICNWRHDEGERGESCALGSAENAAAGKAVRGWDATFLVEVVWPWTVNATAVHPVEKLTLDFKTCVVSLNNDHRWSREAISEWVETVERKLGLWDEPFVVSPVALVESESKEAVKV